jgi:hypothetical protein
MASPTEYVPNAAFYRSHCVPCCCFGDRHSTNFCRRGQIQHEPIGANKGKEITKRTKVAQILVKDIQTYGHTTSSFINKVLTSRTSRSIPDWAPPWPFWSSFSTFPPARSCTGPTSPSYPWLSGPERRLLNDKKEEEMTLWRVEAMYNLFDVVDSFTPGTPFANLANAIQNDSVNDLSNNSFERLAYGVPNWHILFVGFML